MGRNFNSDTWNTMVQSDTVKSIRNAAEVTVKSKSQIKVKLMEVKHPVLHI